MSLPFLPSNRIKLCRAATRKARHGLPRLSFFICLVFSGILLISGCGKGHFGATIPKDQLNVLRYPLFVEPTSLDPATVQDVYTINIIQQVFQGLVQFGTQNQIEPCLASSWEIKNGGKTYLFHIRKGVVFSNGQPLTAQDFKFSLDRACNPVIKSSTAGDYLANVVGAEDCLNGKAKGVAGVKALAPDLLEIDLIKPAYYFLGDLTYPVTYVVASQTVSPTTPITSVTQMIGTGPFVASKYVPSQLFSLKSNPTYFQGKPKIDGVDFPIVKDAITRLNMYRDNQLDILPLMRQDVVSLRKDPVYKSQLQYNPIPLTWYMSFNQLAYKPFANVHIRRAFAMAVDTQTISAKVLQGIEPAATGILPPAIAGYRKQTALLGYHPDEAIKELQAGGYSDGSQLPPLKLYIESNNEDVKLTAEAIQSYIKRNLHFNLQLASLDFGTFLAKNNANELPMFYLGWQADYLDPQDWLSLIFTTHGPANHSGFSNAEVDSLCAAADLMPALDPKRLAMYAKAEDICLQQAAWLPVLFQEDVNLVSPRLHGLQTNCFGFMPYATASIKN